MVKFEDDKIPDKEDSACPDCIIVSFQYDQYGVPTPYLSNGMYYSTGYIHEKRLINETIYVVIHSVSDYLPIYELEELHQLLLIGYREKNMHDCY